MNKPSLGVMPEQIWKAERFETLRRAICERVETTGQIVPLEWIVESNKLIAELYGNPDKSSVNNEARPLGFKIVFGSHNIASPVSAFDDDEKESMSDYEMNGRLLEASLILDCNVMDLIYIKETVKHRGFTADDKAELRGYGFIIKETFEKTITDLTGGSSSVSKGRVCTLMFTLDYIKRRRKKAKKANASNAKQK
ncbi:hypothetical protein [Elizabethkingia meningoseptica]|uniref:hypothetical protein n=1 Tax=Elizabethkingia meningoseptica TaxID=238 RepID=UPI003158BCBB